MIILNSSADEIPELSEKAICKKSNEHPEDMVECPLCKFDYYGDICIPELCNEYDEV